MVSFNPPTPVSLTESTSGRQPCRSENLLYMRKRSAANRAASSPPVPARISNTTFFSSFGSFGTSKALNSVNNLSRRTSNVRISRCASSRMSPSLLSTSSCTCPISVSTDLYSRNVSTNDWISASALACLRYSAGSACTAASLSSVISFSYRSSIALSLSNIQAFNFHRSATRSAPRRSLTVTQRDPPDTGGRKATSSPSRKTVSIRVYSTLTAVEMDVVKLPSSGNSVARICQTALTVAPGGTSRCSSPAPAMSRSRANNRTFTRMLAGTRTVASPHRPDRQLLLRSKRPLRQKTRASRLARSVSHVQSHSDMPQTPQPDAARPPRLQHLPHQPRDGRAGDGLLDAPSATGRSLPAPRRWNDRKSQRFVRFVLEPQHTPPHVLSSDHPKERIDRSDAKARWTTQAQSSPLEREH